MTTFDAKIQCRHCYFFKKKRGPKKTSCKESGILLTSRPCTDFVVNYVGLDDSVKETIQLMGKFKTRDLPLIAYLAKLQKKVNNKKLDVSYSIGDYIFYRHKNQIYKIQIFFIDEDYVYGHTNDLKQFIILHDSVLSRKEARKLKNQLDNKE